MIKLAITADTNGGLIPFVSENIQASAQKCGVSVKLMYLVFLLK